METYWCRQAVTLRQALPRLENNVQKCPTASIVTPVPWGVPLVTLERSVLYVLQSQLPVQHKGLGQKSMVLALGSTVVFYVVPSFWRYMHHDINLSSPYEHVIKPEVEVLNAV